MRRPLVFALLLGLVSAVASLRPAVAAPLATPTSIPNFRDVGGLRASDGSVVRRGLLLRSATPANASAVDAAALTSAGVRTVLDLRGEHDATKEVGARLLAGQTEYLPLLTENMMRRALLDRARGDGRLRFAQLMAMTVAKKLSPSRRVRHWLGGELDIRLARLLDTVSLLDLYWLIVSERESEIRTALEMCAEGEALPMLVHCTHGKDRTGVLVALLLSACGVPEDEIAKDYALSHDWGCSPEGRWAMRIALPERVRPHVEDATLDSWCEAPEDAVRALFARIADEYGSVTAYLESIGIDEAMRAKIAGRMTTTEEAPEQ